MAMDVASDSAEWKTLMVGTQFGDDVEAAWGYKDTYAIYDSSVQCVYFPENEWAWFSNEILSKTTGWYNDDTYGPVASCDNVDLMPTILFMLRGKDGNDYWTEWMAQDYMLEIGSTQECQVCIQPNANNNEVRLGTSFLRGYYAEFDRTAMTVGLGPSTTNTKVQIVQGIAPTRLRGYDTMKVAGLGSGMAVCLGLWLWIVIVAGCYMMNRTAKGSQKKIMTTIDGEAQLITFNE